MIGKKTIPLSSYSNGILIVLILLSFLGLIALVSRSREEALSRLIRLESLYTQEVATPSAWRRIREILGGPYTGQTGEELGRRVRAYDSALADYDAALGTGRENSAVSELRRALGNLIQAYAAILRQREYAFDSLFYFLTIGIFLQSFSLFLTIGQVREARGEILRRDQMINLVQKAREEERRNLAVFLHDSVLQDLGRLGLRPAVREDLEAGEIFRGCVDKLRGVTYSLVPPHLERAGLEKALRDLVAEHVRWGGPEVDFSSHGYDDARVGPETRLVLYRVVQEGLANIRKHAQARRVELRLVVSHPYLILTIRDDGRGFHPREDRDPLPAKGTGLGLALMERQVRASGAVFTLESSPETGTKLQVRFELKGAHL